MKNTFKKRFIVNLIVILMIVCIAAGISVWSYTSLISREEQTCRTNLYNASESAARTITNSINDSFKILSVISEATSKVTRTDPYEAATVYINAFCSMTVFDRIDVLCPGDILLSQMGVRTNVSGLISFEKEAAYGKHISSRVEDPVSGKQVVFCYMPVIHEKAGPALLAGVIDCEKLSEIFPSPAYGGEAYDCIVDRADGSFIMDSRHTQLGNLYEMHMTDTLHGYDNADIVSNIKEGKTGMIGYISSTDRKKTYMHYTPIELGEWQLLTVVSEDTVFAGVSELKSTLAFFSAGIILMLLLYFIWSIHTMRQLVESKTETETQLQVSTVLIDSIKTLSFCTDIHVAINKLLEIINAYFDGDRTYIFSIDYEKKITTNTYEFAAEGVTKEIHKLQRVPLDAIQLWLNKFMKSGYFYISDIDNEIIGTEDTYRILAMQKIHSLIAVPLLEDGVITGFIGVDNPRRNYTQTNLLTSTQFFVTDAVTRMNTRKKLIEMSYLDTLTGMYNRNGFNNYVDGISAKGGFSGGTAYFDLNKLKETNDKYGHEAGDSLIKRAAGNIIDIFGKSTFRIGGDEFVAIDENTDRAEFEKNVSALMRLMEKSGISISCGTAHSDSGCTDINELLKQSDKLMYEDKQRYRAKHKRV